MQLETEEYMTIERVNAVRERAGKLRRQFLKYKDAESVYSLTHDLKIKCSYWDIKIILTPAVKLQR